MAGDGDTKLPTTDQVRPALHMLAVSVPLVSALFGACLRVSLSYHQLFHRLDPFLFRLLVGVLLLLTTGHVACITAETWYLLTSTIQAKEDLQSQKIINACTQVCTTAVALLCQGFYIERLFATTKNVLVRAGSILLWFLSIALFIAWNVKYLLHNGPHLNGDRKYNLGAASLWALAAATCFVSVSLLYFAHQRRKRSPSSSPKLAHHPGLDKHNPTDDIDHDSRHSPSPSRSRSASSSSSKLFQLVSLSIQTFSLLTLNHVASAIGFTSSLTSKSTNVTAATVAFFFFNLFPGLSTYSIVYTLCQRKMELVEQRQKRIPRRHGRGGGGVEVVRRRLENVIKLGGGGGGGGGEQEVKGKEKEKEEEVEFEGTGTGLTAEDDPSNWRGDRTTYNSLVAGGGSANHSVLAGVGVAGGRDDGDRGLEASTGQAGTSEEDGTHFVGRFEEEEGEDDEEDIERTAGKFFSWGTVPVPSLPIQARCGYGGGQNDVRNSRTRGASVQMEEVGHELNWEAFDCLTEARTRPRASSGV